MIINPAQDTLEERKLERRKLKENEDSFKPEGRRLDFDIVKRATDIMNYKLI